VIKLLAIGEAEQGRAAFARVHPTLVHEHDALADVAGSFNDRDTDMRTGMGCLWPGRGNADGRRWFRI
jgi:homoserine dehydrogenase